MELLLWSFPSPLSWKLLPYALLELVLVDVMTSTSVLASSSSGHAFQHFRTAFEEVLGPHAVLSFGCSGGGARGAGARARGLDWLWVGLQPPVGKPSQAAPGGWRTT
jgi:hypothetical protein